MQGRSTGGGAAAWLFLALLSAACEQAATGDSGASGLPDAGGAPDLTPRFTTDPGPKPGDGASPAGGDGQVLDLGQDAAPDAVADPGPADAALPEADGDGGAIDGGGADTADAGPAETSQPITTCEGHCGIYLEDNPCHCSVLCLGEGSCCAGFQELCNCGKDSDCDDGNDCTQDTCNKSNGFCFQQPMKACCKSDAECPPGDACNVAKCIAGTCTKQPIDCNDGISCTQDYCDGGACVHKIAATQCLVDGACLKAGAEDPATAGCATCDPAKSQTSWTAKPGKCAIDGACVATGAANPAAACAVCDPTKSGTAWSVKTGSCFVDAKCFKSGDANPANPCQLCDPTSNAVAWSGKAGFCAIGAECVADKAVHPADPCQVCDVAKSKSAWSTKAGTCAIDGACVANGQAATGSGGCKVCDATKPTQWTIKAGAACSTGSSCLTNAKCDDAGACQGAQKPGCCVKDAECANDPSAVPGPCQEAACDVTSGKCIVKASAGCCTDGVCCDKAGQTVQAKGFACGTFATNYTYECDGNLGYKIAIVYGCDGVSATKCSSAVQAKGQKTVAKTCPAGEICVMSGTTMLCKPQ